MVPKECSIVFIMNLISAPFQLSYPFPPSLPPSIVAMPIELFVLQWSSGLWMYDDILEFEGNSQYLK